MLDDRCLDGLFCNVADNNDQCVVRDVKPVVEAGQPLRVDSTYITERATTCPAVRMAVKSERKKPDDRLIERAAKITLNLLDQNFSLRRDRFRIKYERPHSISFKRKDIVELVGRNGVVKSGSVLGGDRVGVATNRLQPTSMCVRWYLL